MGAREHAGDKKAGNKTNAGLALRGNVGDDRLVIMDNRLAARDDRLVVGDDGLFVDNARLTTEICKRINMDNESEVQVGN